MASLADRWMVTHNSDLEPDNMAAEVVAPTRLRKMVLYLAVPEHLCVCVQRRGHASMSSQPLPGCWNTRLKSTPVLCRYLWSGLQEEDSTRVE